MNTRKIDLPRNEGLHIRARANEIDADPWFEFLSEDYEGDAGPPDYLTRFSGDFDSLYAFNRQFGSVRIDLARGEKHWTGKLKGNAISGDVKIHGLDSMDKIELDLQRLVLMDRKPGVEDTPADPRGLPTLGIKAKSFHASGTDLGALDFWASTTDVGWKILNFNLTRPEFELIMHGNWMVVNEQQLTELNVQFNTPDMGLALETLELPDQIQGGEVDFKGEFSWHGTPLHVNKGTINGNLNVSAKKGQFVQVKQGAGRFFGILDFSSIGRYLMLDFKPIFGKGFPFKTFEGDLTLENGNAYTNNLVARGPSARIAFAGRTGIAAEDYDFNIEVTPRLGGASAVTGWLIWSPQVAAAILALQKLFKKQIKKGTSVVYNVKGDWDNPTVTKISGPAPDLTESDPLDTEEEDYGD